MSTLNISLPEDLQGFVEDQVTWRGYDTSSEYVRDLIRRDQDKETFRALLMEGGASPSAGEADAAWFEALRERVRAKAR